MNTIKHFVHIFSEAERNLGRIRIALLLIVLLCALVYSHTLSVPFYFDDYSYILQNPFIQNPGDIFDRDLIAGTQVYVDVKNSVLSRPLSYLTFSLNFLLNGTTVAGYHLVNILIHMLNSCMVYLLVLISARVPRDHAFDTDRNDRAIANVRLTAFFAAAIFAVHPVMTNAVTYVMQRMASLATLFYLLTIVMYVRSQQQGAGWKSFRWYVPALASAAAAMKSKEIAATLPMMLVLYDFTFLKGEKWQRLLRLAPFFALIAACILMSPEHFSGISQPEGGGNPSTLNVLRALKSSPLSYLTTQFTTNPSSTSIASMSPLEYLYTQFRVIVTYQRMLLSPAGLNFVHDYPFFRSLADPAVAASLVLHVTLVVLAVVVLRRFRADNAGNGPYLVNSAFGVLWFYLALAMECGIIPMDDHMLEHRMYLPSAGFIMAVVSMVMLVCTRMWKNAGRQLASALLVCIVSIFSYLTVVRNEQWRDPLVFWQDASAKSPNKHRIHGYIGNVYRDRGDIPSSLREYRLMLADDFRYWQDHFELGELLMENGMYHEAVEEYLTTLKIWPDKAFVNGRLAEAYRLLGEERLAAEAAKKGNDAHMQTESSSAPVFGEKR